MREDTQHGPGGFTPHQKCQILLGLAALHSGKKWDKWRRRHETALHLADLIQRGFVDGVTPDGLGILDFAGDEAYKLL